MGGCKNTEKVIGTEFLEMVYCLTQNGTNNLAYAIIVQAKYKESFQSSFVE